MLSHSSVKFAPVAPLSLMIELCLRGPAVIGDYHLLLAHDVLRHPEGWSSWAANLRADFERSGLEEPTIIMDTSVIELGMPMEPRDVLHAARIVGAQIMVLPDIIGDKYATHACVVEYFDELGGVDSEHQPLMHMFVPQGTSLPDYLDSLEWASQQSGIDMIGLPRDALQFDGILSRRTLIDACSVIVPAHPIHLLGMSDNVLDDILSCRHSPMVMGIDSAVPIRAGIKAMELKLSVNDYGKRGDYWNAIELGGHLPIINLQWMREAIQPIA